MSLINILNILMGAVIAQLAFNFWIWKWKWDEFKFKPILSLLIAFIYIYRYAVYYSKPEMFLAVVLVDVLCFGLSTIIFFLGRARLMRKYKK